MFRDEEQVKEHLLSLDFDLQSKNLKDKVCFVIFGGTAFLFFSQTFRGTSDIDAYFLNRVVDDEIIQIMNGYDVNNQLQGIAGIPEEFRDRAYELKGFNNLQVYIAHPIDLIVSKLLRAERRDVVDVLDSGIMDHVENLDELRTIYNETRDNQMGHPLRFVDIDQIIDEYIERKK
ncbi:DUF6036 family nucleotidyltransferase [Ammoniphilus sp. 3BR4]|uniref:DUF6036 family nucleotidyltransferase n=1 Tax=Ammoniphilus sp. 3BR4 TaxID=3158265 RepID=UPI003466570C